LSVVLKKEGKIRVLILLFIILIILAVITVAITHNVTLPINVTVTPDLQNILSKNPKLATIVNNQSIDTEYIRDYLKVYNSFSDILYQNIIAGNSAKVTLTVGNKENNIRGFEINGKRYVVHLIACDINYGQCMFRINGIPTGGIKVHNQEAGFDLDNTYRVETDSVTFDYCGTKRFCNLHFEAYDIVNVTVMPK